MNLGSPSTAWTPHTLVSFFDPHHTGPEDWKDDDGLARPPADAPFEYEFEDRGNYLYDCHPHGTPYEAEAGPPDDRIEGNNLFGHRGVIKVAGKGNGR